MSRWPCRELLQNVDGVRCFPCREFAAPGPCADAANSSMPQCGSVYLLNGVSSLDQVFEIRITNRMNCASAPAASSVTAFRSCDRTSFLFCAAQQRVHSNSAIAFEIEPRSVGVNWKSGVAHSLAATPIEQPRTPFRRIDITSRKSTRQRSAAGIAKDFLCAERPSFFGD
jgi:hypothetical protein